MTEENSYMDYIITISILTARVAIGSAIGSARPPRTAGVAIGSAIGSARPLALHALPLLLTTGITG